MEASKSSKKKENIPARLKTDASKEEDPEKSGFEVEDSYKVHDMKEEAEELTDNEGSEEDFDSEIKNSLELPEQNCDVEEENRHMCGDCSECFNEKSSLIAHMRAHTREKPFCCEKCSTWFSLLENLLVHARAHTRARPYTCEDCPKRFRRYMNLLWHMKVHTGSRSFSCEVCEQSFKTKRRLKAHSLRHARRARFSCEECSERFPRETFLAAHMRTHAKVYALRNSTKISVNM